MLHRSMLAFIEANAQISPKIISEDDIVDGMYERLLHNQEALLGLLIQGSMGCSKTAATLSESSLADSFLSGSKTFRLA